MQDVRWQQRFENLEKAFKHLHEAEQATRQFPKNYLYQIALIGAFQFTFELSWKTLKDYLYRAQEGFVNLDSARQSKIDLNERDHCTPCKASEEDRFCEAAASPNSQNLPARGIKYNGIDASLPREVIKQAFHHEIIQDGQTWIQMLEDRNLMAHVYQEETAIAVMDNIQKNYIAAIDQVFHFLKEKRSN